MACRRGEPYPYRTQVHDTVLDESYPVELKGGDRDKVPDEFYDRFADAETRKEVDRLLDRYQTQIPDSIELVVDSEH